VKVSRFFARQYANPSGLFGRFITGFLLNRANAQSNQLVFSALDIAEDSRVLEIGFGGGDLLFKIVEAIGSGSVYGVDPSAAMLKMAEHKKRQCRNPLALQLQASRAESLPFDDAQFDRVCSVNTVYFWPDLGKCFSEMERISRVGGIVVIGLGSADRLQQAGYSDQGFILYSVDAVRQALLACHFKAIDEIEVKRSKRGSFHILKYQKVRA
jgi:arsenite methyltransferase